MATAGIPLRFTWDRKKAAFHFWFHADPEVEAPTELFIPSKWFGEKPSVSVRTNEKDSSIRAEYMREKQRLFIYNNGYAGEAEIIFNK